MGEIAVSNKVIARDEFGRFIAECEAAGIATMRDIANKGAELSREFAPVGKRDDPRTRHLKESITAHYSGTTAYWKADARHAVIVEKTGSVWHTQTGDVSFFWEKAGRMWKPGINLIRHPPTAPKPYLRPAYEIMMATWMDYAKRYYPQ